MIEVAVIVVIIIVLIWYYRDVDYFDWNGTAPPYPGALEAAKKSAGYGNASAAYGDDARRVLDETEALCLAAVSAPLGSRVIFTSGGSESINTVLKAWAKSGPVVISSVEHKTTTLCLDSLKVPVITIPVDSSGQIDLQELAKIPNNVTLVSLIHVGNETGAILPLAEASRIIRRRCPAALFHIDAVQSFGKMPVPLGLVDAVSFSGHKFGALTGIGGLILAPNKSVTPLIHGTQQGGLRGGTEPIAAIASLQYALKTRMAFDSSQLIDYKLKIARGLGARYRLLNYDDFYGKPEDYEVPGSGFGIVLLGGLAPCKFAVHSLWLSIVKFGDLNQHFCNLRLRDYLQKRGIIVSTGAACNKGVSPVLSAIKAPFIIRCGVLRISWGDRTKSSSVSRLIKNMIAGIEEQA